MIKKSLQIFAVSLAIIILGLATRHYIINPSISQPVNISTSGLYTASFEDASGKSQLLKQWQGKIIVVNFWATWCPPCREEMPELSHLQDQYHDNNVIVLGISTDDVAKIREFSKEVKVSYPLLAADMEGMNLAASLGNDKGILPYTVIIKADGTVAKTYFGRIDQPLLEQTLLPLIKLAQSS
ncbi:MAG TPA: TlpA disulfide reductase family protein [Methylophilaceae bacterium]|jgi:thiol-disulfide isomerase/thioredoxin